MTITATEFKTNLNKYLDMLQFEDIFITKNGKTVAKITHPHISAVESISGLLEGKLPNDFDEKKLREERIAKYAGDN